MKRNKRKFAPILAAPEPKFEFGSDEYGLVPREKYSRIPINTHIGYVYKAQNGKIITIRSGFVLQHLITPAGVSVMSVIVGNKVWNNPYDDFIAIYYYLRDMEKIKKLREMTPKMEGTLVGMADRITRLEKKMDVLMRRSI